jgi:hypothetical protein
MTAERTWTMTVSVVDRMGTVTGHAMFQAGQISDI